jgi:aryl-alcohol dehydrogenase-like predicted oxidoreductase
MGRRHDRSPGEVAIAWTLRHAAVTAAIVGARNVKQVNGVVGGAELQLTEAEIAEIEG